ncbi:hypothetical protein [Actinophytocola xanthii]|nr:hypothetical protein [Actinophytocola xanthii]
MAFSSFPMCRSACYDGVLVEQNQRTPVAVLALVVVPSSRRMAARISAI